MVRTGRPTNDPKRHTLQMRVSKLFLLGLDVWRSKHVSNPSRSNAIRLSLSLTSEISSKFLERIDEYIEDENRSLTRADAVHELIEKALNETK